ncbi:MAG: hypothetical protein PHU94_01125 [Bacilli bacterium]|nr:hypothetical protein [Bacilli bacterium]MDD4733312.1 hypothetical protein [Bacilli bacterium]
MNFLKSKKLKITAITILILIVIVGGLFIYEPKIEEPTIDFGYQLDDGEELTIKKVKAEPIEDVTIYAYDFNFSSGQPEGAIEISIPYSDKGIKKEEEKISICAKYFNEETKQWEDVFYIVDPEENVVKIITDHLSTYAVFKITNPNKRSAYISEVNAYAAYLSKEKAVKMIETYAEQGPNWKEDVVKSTLETFGSLPMFLATSASTVITLGGAYDSYVTKAFNDSISNLGIATACAQLAYDAYNNGLNSKETSVSAWKTTLNVAINFTTPSIQLAYVGVGMIDLALTDVSTFAVSNKYRSTKNMYDEYYKRNNIKRNVKDWVKIFEKIYKDNKADPQMTLDLISKEIDRYVNEYWEVAATDYSSWIDSYDKNGTLAKYPWPEAKHRENISNVHKEELYSLLQSTFRVMSRNIYLDSIAERQKEYEKLAKEYNQKYTVNIRENKKNNEKSTWAGYYARFSPISSKADIRSWTIKLDENGEGKITFSLLGHQIAGYPMKIDLYKDGSAIESGEKSLTVTLKTFKTKQQNINLTPRKAKEEEKEEPIEEDKKGHDKQPVEESNPWYQAIIMATDNSKAFAGWSAVLAYPDNVAPDLKNMYKTFKADGKCEIYFQSSDIESLDGPRQFWLYKNSADLLAKKKPDQIVTFSLSGSYSGEMQGEPLYKIIVKAAPKKDEGDGLEAISGKYSSYMIYSLYIQEYDLNGSPAEMRNEERFGMYEKPSGVVTLHYNGETLSFISSGNPNQSFGNEILLDKLSNSRYQKIINNNGTINTYLVEIGAIGNSATVTINTDNNASPKRVLKQEYRLIK